MCVCLNVVCVDVCVLSTHVHVCCMCICLFVVCVYVHMCVLCTRVHVCCVCMCIFVVGDCVCVYLCVCI